MSERVSIGVYNCVHNFENDTNINFCNLCKTDGSAHIQDAPNNRKGDLSEIMALVQFSAVQSLYCTLNISLYLMFFLEIRHFAAALLKTYKFEFSVSKAT